MGKIVDTELRVIGVEGLMVVDASVLSCPIGVHYQVVTYRDELTDENAMS